MSNGWYFEPLDLSHMAEELDEAVKNNEYGFELSPFDTGGADEPGESGEYRYLIDKCDYVTYNITIKTSVPDENTLTTEDNGKSENTTDG
jgi:hypothetical protein